MQLADTIQNDIKVKQEYQYNQKPDYLDAFFIWTCWMLLGVMMVFANIAKHSVIFQTSSGAFLIVSFFYLLLKKAIRIAKYHLITLLFIVYNIILILLGIAVDAEHSYKMVVTVSLNLLLSVLVYSMFVYFNDVGRMLRTYVNVSVISVIVILFVYRDSLFGGRLAFSWGDTVSNYNLFGINVITAGSNGIGFFSSIAFIVSSYLFITSRRSRYFFYDVLFAVTILATGSRKSLVILILGLFLVITIVFEKSKKWLYISIGAGLCVLLYLLMTSIPALYEVMGSRMEELFHLLMNQKVSDSSINTRMRLIEISMEFFKQRPVFGYGLDAFRVIGPWGIITDNNYLEIAVSSGVIGLVIYYSYTVFAFLDYIRLQKKSNVCKLFFGIFVLILAMEYGSVIYFERSFDFVHTMLFFILFIEKGTQRYAVFKEEKKN